MDRLGSPVTDNLREVDDDRWERFGRASAVEARGSIVIRLDESRSPIGGPDPNF
jgi:hypothetical protein